MAAWEEAVGRYPEYALAHNNLAVAYWKMGDLGRAKKELETASELGLDVSEDLWRMLGDGTDR